MTDVPKEIIERFATSALPTCLDKVFAVEEAKVANGADPAPIEVLCERAAHWSMVAARKLAAEIYG